jgi:hypothetical protein
MTTTQAPTDSEFLAQYDKAQYEKALTLLASLPKRRVRARKIAK